MKYAQGEVSFEFKALVKEAVKSADTEDKLDAFMNVLHDLSKNMFAPFGCI